MQAQEAAGGNKPKKGGAKGAHFTTKLQFSELTDKFLTVKGKALRNLRKKQEKYADLRKQAKSGEALNAQQQQQVDTLPQINADIKELEELCDLYVESNPDYDSKGKAPKLTDEDVSKAVSSSLKMVAQVANLRAMLDEDASLVESSEAEQAGVRTLAGLTDAAVADAGRGSAAFEQSDARDAFVAAFTKLASKTDEPTADGGVTFADLNGFVARSVSNSTQILQRIADKSLAKKVEEEAAAAAAAAAAKEAEEKAKAAEAEAAAAAEAAMAAEAKPEKAEDADVVEGTPVAEAATEEKKGEAAAAEETSGDKAEGEIVAGEDQAAQRGGRRGRGGRGDRGDRGDRGRGGRGGRGYRGGRRGGRDDDDFIVETNERPDRRRGGFRGRRGGDYRGERGGRGDGERRGGRGGRPPREGQEDFRAGGAQAEQTSGAGAPAQSAPAQGD